MDSAQQAEKICRKLSQYFGQEYEVTSNNVDVFTVRSSLEHRAYIESQDMTVVRSIAGEFGLKVASWRIVAANGQMGLYCVFAPPEEVDAHFT